ncbi:MAG: class I SAM-dependent methyltransferase [Anaerolineaceae bacterium]|jgi:23S rRNA (cytosine1962-C5)-methyltransferase|nr:class I SAM-dependent methyltransferase [Anaerolineaceae bacterium]MDD4043568.1 class I SAM-dependent methyltransferase [Anaerolineaceae bacterium]MDD4578210.1 class I SAM-dependent methyltransferase [Anaerolineaceae bacterium]
MSLPNNIVLTPSPDWKDYQLLDSGDGKTLERFGDYLLIRPRPQAIWRTSLAPSEWKKANAILVEEKQEYGGKWNILNPMDKSWMITYKDLRFQLQLSSSRHVGIFPEQATHWDWLRAQIEGSKKPFRMLNLFGYSGAATLAGAAAGAEVTHVDSSKHAITWANQNTRLSKLQDKPVRWIAEDALKFVKREGRRGSTYQGIVMDPPKFGRGSSGEVWDFFKRIPELIEASQSILAKDAKFLIMTAYAITASAVVTHQAVEQIVGKRGKLESGELITVDESAGNVLSHAIYTRWSA